VAVFASINSDTRDDRWHANDVIFNTASFHCICAKNI